MPALVCSRESTLAVRIQRSTDVIYVVQQCFMDVSSVFSKVELDGMVWFGDVSRFLCAWTAEMSFVV